MRRWPCLLAALILALGLVCATAEEICLLDETDENVDVFTGECFICVSWTLPETKPVTVCVNGPEGMVYQRDYGLCSGVFRSEEIYLDTLTDPTTYQVLLNIGGEEHTFLVERTGSGDGWMMEEFPVGQSH